MGLSAWWQHRKTERAVNRAEELLFAYWWKRYKQIDSPQRKALVTYVTAHRSKMQQAALLWEQGYRHGDHVLVYDAPLGLFTEQVVTRFYEEPALMPPDMAARFEETQGTRVRLEDRSQRRFQPDLSSHETGFEAFVNDPGLAERLEMAVDDVSTKRKHDRELREQAQLLGHYYSLFVNDPEQYDKQMAELARRDPRMAEEFKYLFDGILEDYRNMLEKEIGAMEEELARTYEAIEEELKEMERERFGEKPNMNCSGEADEGGRDNSVS